MIDNTLEGSLYATHTHAVKRLNELIEEGEKEVKTP